MLGTGVSLESACFGELRLGVQRQFRSGPLKTGAGLSPQEPYTLNPKTCPLKPKPLHRREKIPKP